MLTKNQLFEADKYALIQTFQRAIDRIQSLESTDS
jgi:hypothetical protein